MFSRFLFFSFLTAVICSLTDDQPDNRAHPIQALTPRQTYLRVKQFPLTSLKSAMLETWLRQPNIQSKSSQEPYVKNNDQSTTRHQSILEPEDCGIANDFSQATNDIKITGGNAASPHQFPWQVLVTDKDLNFVCGGSVIGSRWILTAAHCVDSSQEILIIMGAHVLSEFEAPPGQAQMSERIFIHPSWDASTLTGDIALIKLPQNITFSDYVRPICLPNYSDTSDHVGDPVTLTGWGRFSDSSTDIISDDLRSVNLTVITNVDCSRSYSVITRDIVCASGVIPKGTCSGDSGGPMNYYDPYTGRWTLMGVTSFGSISGCEKGFPNGFTRVRSYLDWIHCTMNSASGLQFTTSAFTILIFSCFITLKSSLSEIN